jgi:hypothetical protein
VVPKLFITPHVGKHPNAPIFRHHGGVLVIPNTALIHVGTTDGSSVHFNGNVLGGDKLNFTPPHFLALNRRYLIVFGT